MTDSAAVSRREASRPNRFPDSIESRSSWVAATITVLILAISYGAPLVAVVGLKPIATSLGTERSVVALASALVWVGTGLGGIAMGWIADRIGVRLTVGARERDVQTQFLAEAVAVGVLGGVAGVPLGIAVSVVASRMFRWPSLISPTAIAVAVILSLAVGILFGYYPARTASRLDPIEAIRYE